MNLRQISVEAEHCFGEHPLVLNNLAKVNFLFAPNGSGKTTISKALERQPKDAEDRRIWAVAPTESVIRVFNESFKSRVVNDKVDGIFTIGEESAAVDSQVKRHENEAMLIAREIEEKRLKVGSETSMEPSSLWGQINAELTNTRDITFEAHKDTPESLKVLLFKGGRGDRKKLLQIVLQRFDSEVDYVSSDSWEGLRVRLATISGEADRRQAIPKLSITSVINNDDINALGKEQWTGGSGPLGTLISLLGHSDWVNSGREHAENASGLCPYCQQELPADFDSKLSEFFADGFDQALLSAKTIQASVKTKSEKLFAQVSAIENALDADGVALTDPMRATTSTIVATAKLLLARLEEKLDHPTRPISVEDTVDHSNILNGFIDEHNAAIGNHNALLDNADKERDNIIESGWRLFLSGTAVRNQLRRYRGIDKSKKKAIQDLEDEIDQLTQERSTLHTAITGLQNSIANTSTVAKRINQLLLSLGFHRFKLVTTDVIAGGYRIERADGSLAHETLSEGEKTFLAFAYFVESLSGSTTAGGNSVPTIAIFDDPISSLDSDTLFMVSAHIREMARSVTQGSGNVTQLFVLTHNTQFHHEASYMNGEPSEADRSYFRLSRLPSGISSAVYDGSRSRITSSYELLWQSVVDIASGDNVSAITQVGIFNVVRRIIEGYFRTVASTRDVQRQSVHSATDQRLLMEFDIWANSGSHTIIDGFAQSSHLGSTERFLQLFQIYFRLQGHAAHFDMMIRARGGKELLLEGALFGAASD